VFKLSAFEHTTGAEGTAFVAPARKAKPAHTVERPQNSVIKDKTPALRRPAMMAGAQQSMNKDDDDWGSF
ncbi:MAG: methyl-accepting chemotaxis protein, partial [Comamonas sp.]|nr:methyl-accepting chemotaxis protein [Comamonas sp.]